jgi:dihydroxy-acid dehydratase
MYARHIGQADTGCDFDFLQRSHGETVKEPDIF